MSYIEKEKAIKADLASIENRVRHAFNQGYDLGYKEGKATASNKAVAELGEDLRKTRTAICNKKVLIGFNLAIAVMNKHLGGVRNESRGNKRGRYSRD